jgi:hypothetical protein
VCDVVIVGEPLPPGLVEPQPASVPAGSSAQAVSLDLASIGATLQPDTTYHFRVIAADTSDGKTVHGADQTFTTPEAGVRPLPFQAPSGAVGSGSVPQTSSSSSGEPRGSTISKAVSEGTARKHHHARQHEHRTKRGRQGTDASRHRYSKADKRRHH